MTRCLCVHTHASTQASTCKLCMLTSRMSCPQTRLPAESSRRCCTEGTGSCGADGRHTVRLTPFYTRSARAQRTRVTSNKSWKTHACMKESSSKRLKEEGGGGAGEGGAKKKEFKEERLHRRNSAKCPHLRKRKQKWIIRDTYMSIDKQTHSPWGT